MCRGSERLLIREVASGASGPEEVCMLRVPLLGALLLLSSAALPARAADPPGSDRNEQKLGKLPHLEFDVNKKQVRVECEMRNSTTSALARIASERRENACRSRL